MVYPDNLYPSSTLEKIGQSPASVRERHRLNINKVMRKYGINTAVKMSHFLGQGAVESFYLTLMIEGSVSFAKNPQHASFLTEQNGYYNPPAGGYLDYLNNRLGNIEAGDGPKFRGRGMKQLTGRENYSKYWVYRGWLDKNSFKSNWWNPVSVKNAPVVDNPQLLSISSYNAIDAGGWYWEAGSAHNKFASINKTIGSIVNDGNIELVTKAINGGLNGIEERRANTKRIAKILMD